MARSTSHISRSHLRVSLGRKSIVAEASPWEHPADIHEITLASTVTKQYSSEHGNLSLFFRGQDRCRLYIWGMIKMVASGAIPATDLFQSDRKGERYVLRPNPPSLVPFQAVHVGARTIPNSLADTLCSVLGVRGLLLHLNSVLGTSYDLHDPGMQNCLEYFAGSSVDFGVAYGHLRNADRADFANIIQRLSERVHADIVMRHKIIEGSYISSTEVEPRRVWDLLSNRVLPFHVVPKSSKRRFPQDVWTVSHSWVSPDARQLVWTPVNGRQWPVPIPQSTSLDHVRVELLNLGIEYAWLDVLCIRQVGRPEDEAVRDEELKLDIPTIGYVYSLQWPCVTYFNGLGLPFDPSPLTLSSPQHWTNRVWTLQEATDNWVPAGATGVVSDEARAFFMNCFRDKSIWYGKWHEAVRSLQGRHCTSEHDRVCALAYLFSCATLPVYDTKLDTQVAWTVLIKHVSPGVRGSIAVRYAERFPGSSSLFPSLAELPQCVPETDTVPLWNPVVELMNPSCLSTSEPGIYFQRTSRVGTLSVTRQHAPPVFTPFGSLKSIVGDPPSPSKCSIRGDFRAGTEYTVLDFGGIMSLVVEIIGQRSVQGTTCPVVVKRGCILFASGLPWGVFENFDRIMVLYS